MELARFAAACENAVNTVQQSGAKLAQDLTNSIGTVN